jgi:hypothetical protein
MQHADDHHQCHRLYKHLNLKVFVSNVISCNLSYQRHVQFDEQQTENAEQRRHPGLHYREADGGQAMFQSQLNRMRQFGVETLNER